MTRFLTVDQPTQSGQRRRAEFRPRKLDPHIDGLSVLELAGVLVASLAVIVLLSVMSGCVSTEFASGQTTVTRTSILSDVQVEATLGADGSITVKETQAQDAMGKLIDRIPAVTP